AGGGDRVRQLASGRAGVSGPTPRRVGSARKLPSTARVPVCRSSGGIRSPIRARVRGRTESRRPAVQFIAYGSGRRIGRAAPLGPPLQRPAGGCPLADDRNPCPGG